MRCPFFALLLLALPACTPASDFDPDLAFAQAEQAIRDHDAETAYSLLAEAARQDHLRSLALLLDSSDRGFLVPGASSGTESVRLPLPDGAAPQILTGFRFVRAINRGVRAGDLLALRYHASSLRASDDPEDRRQAERIYHDLLTSDIPASDLYHLAMMMGTDAERQRLTRLAAAEGDAQACSFSVWFYEDDPQTSWRHTAGIARYLDRIGACTPDRPIPAEAFGPLRDLRAQLDLENPAAAVALDSLAHLGVFERHPELAEALADHAPSVRS